MDRIRYPHNEHAEKSVLASMVQVQQALDEGMEHLRREDFYLPHCRALYDAIQALYASGSSVDVVSVGSQIEGAPEALQGYFFDLLDMATTPNVEGLCKDLRDYSQARDIIKTCHETALMCQRNDVDVDFVVQDSERRLFQMFDRTAKQEMVSVASIVPEVVAQVKRAQDSGGPVGLETGFSMLDKQTTGLHGGDLVILAARPGMGKTSLALAIANHVAGKRGSVGFFSCEMPRHQIVQRLACIRASVSMTALRGGRLTNVEHNRFELECCNILNLPIHIDDSANVNAMAVRSASRRLKAKHGLSLVILDYLQLMATDGKKSRNEEVGYNSRMLKLIAKELDVPVICLSQLSRECEKRQDKRPMLSDLRDSGSIEQDADMVLFIYRDEEYNDKTEDKGVAELIIDKQRNGPTGTIRLAFENRYTRFSNLDDRPEPVEVQGKFKLEDWMG